MELGAAVLHPPCREVLMGIGQPQPGRSHPIGARVYPDGVNFSVFS